MQSENKALDELARLLSGAAGAAHGLRSEVEARMKDQVQRLLERMDLVTREEFEVVKALAEKARAEQEKLRQELDELKAKIAAPS